jgi:hypothetical protein
VAATPETQAACSVGMHHCGGMCLAGARDSECCLGPTGGGILCASGATCCGGMCGAANSTCCEGPTGATIICSLGTECCGGVCVARCAGGATTLLL